MSYSSPRFLQAFIHSIKLLIEAAPFEFGSVTLLNLVLGAGPAITLFLSKIVIDEVTEFLDQNNTEGFLTIISYQSNLFWAVIGLIVLNFILDSIETVTGFALSSLRDRVQGSVQGRILHKIATFDDIALFESPELLNIVQLAEQGVSQMQRLASVTGNLLTGVFTFIPVFLISASIGWWIPLVLFLLTVPSIYTQLHYEERSWSVESAQAGVVREMNLYTKVLSEESYAKELRLFKLQSLLLERWKALFWSAFTQMRQVRKQGLVVILACSMLSGLGIAIPYFFVLKGVLDRTYTLGDLALYTGLIFEIRRSLFILIGNTADIYDVALSTAPIFALLNLQSKLQSGSRPNFANFAICQKNEISTNLHAGSSVISVQNVSFAYPGSEKKALSNITFNIQAGETVALIGENGAGKTTLAKLLCRLYDPVTGSICWNGNDLQSLDLDYWRECIAVVMQDFARFPVTLRENIGFGLLSKLDDDNAIIDAAIQAGLALVVNRLPQGLDTPLGKQLEGGVDLSGGQWQRVALARAFIRLSQAKLLIFDEPTAALDPKIEYEVYQMLQDMAKQKTTVIISHRLALTKFANRLLVLENGSILESGTHKELMDLKGRYYEMFSRQANSYIG